MGGLGQTKKGPELLNLSQVCLKISVNQVITIITSAAQCHVGWVCLKRRALALPGSLALKGLIHE